MENRKMIITVPTDFTKEAECAAVHAVTIASKANGMITLVHVLNRESKKNLKKTEKTEEDLKAILKKDCDKIRSGFGVEANFVLPEGSIFSAIGDSSEALGAKLVVMGTHGVVGLEQKLLGAWALRVVSDSPVPVIIVQNKWPDAEGYKKVMVTADYNKESKQLVTHAIGMAKLFGGEVLIFEGKEGDEFLSRQTQNNTQFCVRLCEANGVKYRVIKQAGSDYNNEMLKTAVTENVDLICIMSRKDMDLKNVILGDAEQRIINNEAQIPVMCANPAQKFGITNMVLNP